MKIAYTGRQVELTPAQLKKLESRFVKIGKLLDGRRECEAHVILSLERHLHHAEATVNYYGHQLAGLGSSTDLFTAIAGAAEKLEKQAVKARTKGRDTKRQPHKAASEVETDRRAPGRGARVAELEAETEKRVYRINHHQRRKRPRSVHRHWQRYLHRGCTRDFLGQWCRQPRDPNQQQRQRQCDGCLSLHP